jgi:CBS domain-containing protein
MEVREICVKDVVTIEPEADLTMAAVRMRENHVGDLVVVEAKNGDRIPVGIVTDRDLVIRGLAGGVETFQKLLVRDLLVQRPFTVRAEDDIAQVLALMREHGVRRLPVVDAKGALVGIVAYDDLIELVAGELSELASVLFTERANEARLRPRPRAVERRNEWR